MVAKVRFSHTVLCSLVCRLRNFFSFSPERSRPVIKQNTMKGRTSLTQSSAIISGISSLMLVIVKRSHNSSTSTESFLSFLFFFPLLFSCLSTPPILLLLFLMYSSTDLVPFWLHIFLSLLSERGLSTRFSSFSLLTLPSSPGTSFKQF